MADAKTASAMRSKTLLGSGALASLTLLGLCAADPAPRLLWNGSASVPVGLYLIDPTAAPRRGDLVVAWLPREVRELADARRYLPRNVPLLKPVAAVAGDRVCAGRSVVTVSGAAAAYRRPTDSRSRPLPAWVGCRTLDAGQFLLISPARSSFDGRYFGVTEARDIVGTAWRL